MSVLVILEMMVIPTRYVAAAAELEARRPTSAITAPVVAPTEGGVVVCTVWESAAARDAYQSEPEHQEALQAASMAALTGYALARVRERSCRCVMPRFRRASGAMINWSVTSAILLQRRAFRSADLEHDPASGPALRLVENQKRLGAHAVMLHGFGGLVGLHELLERGHWGFRQSDRPDRSLRVAERTVP